MLDSKKLPLSTPAGQKLSNRAKKSIWRAFDLAREKNASQIEAIHLFLSILEEKGSLGANILEDLGVKKELALKNSGILKKSTTKKTFANPIISKDLQQILTRAYAIAKKLNCSYVGTEHLVYAILETPGEEIKKIIFASGKNKLPKISAAAFPPAIPTELSPLFEMPEISFKKKKNSSSRAFYLEKFCVDLKKKLQEKKETTIGREKEISRMVHILARKNKNNPILTGHPGTGKTALVMGLVEYISSEEAPAFLSGKKIFSLDIASLIAGTSFRGEFESRLKEILKEAAQEKNIILFIDEIHNIIGAGNIAGSLDLANILKPALSSGEVQIIGATTLNEYKRHIEKDQALERRFQPVHIKEPEREETRRILFGIKKSYEDFHSVTISPQAIDAVLDLTERYIKDRFFPDKAIDVIDETAARIRSTKNPAGFSAKIKSLFKKKARLEAEKEKMAEAENYEKAIEIRAQEKKLEKELALLKKKQHLFEKENRSEITARDIIETVANISRVPEEKISQAKNQRFKNIETTLSAQIIGQKEIFQKISGVLLRSQMGISSPERPMGSFLFLGPTGTGKTLTAKILAREFFDTQGSLIRIDMSEFMERHSVSGLIGSPAGYVGYGEGGRLTEKVRRNPHSVVLFDEIEKAHSDVFNILLQILEDGVLTDSEGLEVSFKNTIVILTSNIETEGLSASPLGFRSTSQPENNSPDSSTIFRSLENKLRPELLNRLDHILLFNSLKKTDIESIVRLELKKLSERLKKQELTLNFSANLPAFIAKKSHAEKQGARMIRRNIQELVENSIARLLLEDKVRNKKIKIGVVKEKIAVR